MKCGLLCANLTSALTPAVTTEHFCWTLLMWKVGLGREKPSCLPSSPAVKRMHPTDWALGSDYIPGLTGSKVLVTSKGRCVHSLPHLNELNQKELLALMSEKEQRWVGSPPLVVWEHQKGKEEPWVI